jgi:hypothetical protein
MFLFSIGLAGVAVAHLLVGILAEKAVCESLQHPTPDNQFMNLADQFVNLDDLYPPGRSTGVTLSHIIR